MKKLLITIMLLTAISLSFAQTITWKKLTSFPNTTSGAEPIVLNNEIYYIPSSYAPQTITSDFYKYDISTDTWVQLANMPEAKGNLAVGEASGKIYAIGGGFTKTNFQYTPETDTWQTLASMPTARQHIDCGVVDNKIYVIGGITSFTNITKKNEVYNTETNTWSEKAPIPTLRNNPAIVAKDSLIYVIGGAGSEMSIWETIATVECYNTKTNEWTSKADIPFVLFKPGAVVVENKIVVLGGQDQSGSSVSSVLIYDIESDTWEETTPLPKINCFAGFVSLGNKIYVIGGTTSAPDWTYYSDVYEGTIASSGIQEDDMSPKNKIILSNYPNPFNPKTTIKFDLKMPLDNGNLNIFNSSGELVKKYSLSNKKAGNHEISFCAIGLNSGMYYYRIEADGLLGTSKMLLLK
jgi:N-acetylneuraminic acid mutarotase